MKTIQIVNLKCGGCAKSIADALEKEGMENVSVDTIRQEVFFDGDMEVAKKVLSRLGYPEKGSPEAESLFKKAKSFLSCAKGKMKK